MTDVPHDAAYELAQGIAEDTRRQRREDDKAQDERERAEMAEKAKLSVWAKVKAFVIQDAPPEMAACEAECCELHCSKAQWNSCQRRLGAMEEKGTAK
jgi:hypothetical protein